MKPLKKNLVFLFTFVLFFSLNGKAYAIFGTDSRQHQQNDQKRIEDILQISGYVEEYYKKTGSYPLADEPQARMVVSIISNAVPRGITSDIQYSQLEKALENKLGRQITLPKDPEEGQDWRLYQYATDGQNYYVSTFLYNQKPYAAKQGDHHNKVEITSRPNPKYRQFKRRDIKRFETIGMDKNELQKAFFTAIQENDFKAAEQAIKKGANPSPVCGFHQRCQPLAIAAEKGDLEKMRFLIKNGADLDGYNAYYDVALIYALGAGQKEAAKLLIKSGANVNLPNAFGVSPFLGVCGEGDTELVRLMIEHGANVNRNFLMQNSSAGAGQKNFRPLEAAIKGEAIDVISLLLKAGADPDLKDSNGKTMKQRAFESKNPAIQKLF